MTVGQSFLRLNRRRQHPLAWLRRTSGAAAVATVPSVKSFDRWYETGAPALERLGPGAPYHPLVFLTPPWPAIYAKDKERRHDMDAALAEYDRLLAAYHRIGHQVAILAKVDVARRADHILDLLGSVPEL